jgi:hypothetical protein
MSMLTESPRFQAVRVCREHGGLYEPAPDPATGVRQQCHEAANAPTWEGRDFNEWIHLCECCQQEAMPSGWRFSPFFCKTCYQAIRMTRAGIPVGRHSLMNGVVLNPQNVPGFVSEVGSMFSAIDVLHAWSRKRVLRLVGPSETDPLLVDVIAAARKRGTRAKAVRELVAVWRKR